VQHPKIFIVRVSPDPGSLERVHISARAVDQEQPQVFRSLSDFGQFIAAAATSSNVVAPGAASGSAS
jgi:hypothetical protein